MRSLILLLLIVAVKAKVKISVYYETLCPDSIAFIKNQLFVNYIYFGPDYIDLELIPYGFAKETDSNGTKNFVCQHGIEECYGNKVHGCVVSYGHIVTSLYFVHCSESSFLPTSQDTLQKCAQLGNIPWINIQTCLDTKLADQIMSKNGEKTRKLNPQFIPAVVFNNRFSQTDQDDAIQNLKNVICRYLNYAPRQCNGYASNLYADVIVL
ncbi:GILT-like protein 1 [Rhynchophorus ferrugineus]|uniref:GILT-like protein 1 n=1 Tax=Rhynchophorus ferrugineus TaxID=354439 RepID=UPI003FCC8AA4